MAGTTAFKRAWRRGNAKRVALAKLVLVRADESASDTYYLAGSEVQTPVGTSALATLWQGVGVDFGPVQADGSFIATDFMTASTKIRIGRTRLATQARGYDLHDMLVSHRFEPQSTLTLYLWERSLTSFNDALQVFHGEIEVARPLLDSVEIIARQGKGWNDDFPPWTVTLPKYPGGPDSVVGQVLGAGLGKLQGHPGRAPFPEYGTIQNVIEKIAGGSRAHQAVLVDPGMKTGKAKVVVAGHKLNALGGVGTSMFMRGDDGKLHVVEPDPADIFLADAESGFYMTDGSPIVWQPVYPTETINMGVDDAQNRFGILDPFNDAQYATLDYDAGARILRARLPSVSHPGVAKKFFVYVIYRTLAMDPQAELVFYSEELASGVALNLIESTTPTFQVIDLSNNPDQIWGINNLPALDRAWDFSAHYVGVQFDAVATGSRVYVYAIGCTAGYVPTRDIIHADRVIEETRVMYRKRSPWSGVTVHMAVPGSTPQVVPGIKAMRGQFFANFSGAKDDGAGTFSADPDEVVDLPPDLARLVLQRWGGLTTADIETGIGVHGSFVDARAQMQMARGGQIRLGLGIAEAIDIETVLTFIATGSLSWIFVSQYDNKFKFVPWLAGRDTTWDHKIGREEFSGDPSASRIPGSRISAGVSIPYAWDEHRRSYAHEVAVTAKRSVGGYQYRNLPDQTLRVITGENDWIDFVSEYNDVTASVQLNSDDYTIDTFLTELRDKIYLSALSDSVEWAIGFGAIVTEGVNDRIPASTGVAILTPGAYVSQDDLAAEAQTQLGASWTVTHNATTGKFTFANPSSTTIDWIEANDNSAAALFGFTRESTDPGNGHESDFAVPMHHFVISSADVFGSSNNFDMLWDTGTHAAQNASGLLGFDPLHDSAAGQPFHVGITPKGTRERTFRESVERYRTKRESAIEARAIYDTDAALEVRNRLADLSSVARVEFEGTSYWFTGIDRGEVFECQSDLDDDLIYPDPDSDGSWADKKIVVLTTEQMMGPEHFGTRVVGLSVEDSAAFGVDEEESGQFAMFASVVWLFGNSQPTVKPRMRMIAEDGTLPFAEVALSATSSAHTGGGDTGPFSLVNVIDGSTIGVWLGGDNRVVGQKLDAAGAKLWATDGAFIDASNDLDIWMSPLVPDGAGGCFVAYCKLSTDGIRVARIASDSTFPSGWAADGVLIHSTGQKEWAWMCSDDAGGVIVVWIDRRLSFRRVYAQRIDAIGAQLWTSGGILIGISGGSDSEQAPRIVADGNGGAFISWDRQTSLDETSINIYAQHVTPSGTVSWTAGGVALCVGQTSVQRLTGLAPDGTGGCIVAWTDTRGADRIFAQRVNNLGVVQWAANGIDIMASGSYTSGFYPQVVSDLEGGVIVIRATGSAIKAQRVTSAGALLWGVDGMDAAIATTSYVSAAADGSGGAVFAWVAAGADIWAQRLTKAGVLMWGGGAGIAVATGSTNHQGPFVSVGLIPIATAGTGAFMVSWQSGNSTYVRAIAADGTLAYLGTNLSAADLTYSYPKTVRRSDGSAITFWAQFSPIRLVANSVDAVGSVLWGAGGVEIETGDPKYVYHAVAVCADGLDGAYVVWADETTEDVRIARINSSGAFPSGWGIDGIVLEAGTAFGTTFYERKLIADGFGGAIAAWITSASDVHVQRINPDGTNEWAAGGVAVNSGTTDCQWVSIVADGSGGCFVVFPRGSASVADIYVQHITAAGSAAWTAGGVVICTGQTGDQAFPSVVLDNAGGVIVAWYDERGGSGRVYAQRVNSSGVVQWAANGVDVTETASVSNPPTELIESLTVPQMVSDLSGGAIIVTRRTSTNDIRAKRINGSGAGVWGSEVVVAPASSGTRDQFSITPDGVGGFGISWTENKSGTADVYAQWVDVNGNLQWVSTGIPIAEGSGSFTKPHIAR